MAEVYTITMNKGGSSKTTLVSNLVGALTRTQPDKKILLIDTDGQGNLSIAFGHTQPNEFEYTIYDVLTEGMDPKEVIMELAPNLHICPANKDMNFFELDILPNISNYPEPFKLLSNAFAGVLDDYDYIFIDTPPSMGLVAGNVLTFADKVVIPFAPEAFGVNGLVNVIEGVIDFKRENNPGLEIAGVVGMMVDLRTNLHTELMKQARAYCERESIPMYETMIPRSIRFANATAYDNQPATLSDAGNKIVKRYYDLLEEVLGHGAKG